MKKSRITKLALSGAAVAALAATFSTSTYAWYVSNKTASTSAATGSTASADSDGSVLLSTSGDYGKFYKTISLGSLGDTLLPSITSDGVTFNTLGSASYAQTADTTFDANMVYYTKSGDNYVKANVTAGDTISGTYYTKQSTTTNDGNGTCYHISFYMLSTQNGTVTPSITVKNLTTTYTPQQNLSGYAVPYSGGTLTTGQTFTANVLNALSLSFQYTPATKIYGASGYSAAGDTYAADTENKSGVYGNHLSGSNAATTSTTVSQYITTYNTTAITDNIPTAKAHDYYESVTGYELTAAQKTQFTYTNAIGAMTIATANTVYKMDYYLYLDGADDLCFNSCALQDLSIEFSFELN